MGVDSVPLFPQNGGSRRKFSDNFPTAQNLGEKETLCRDVIGYSTPTYV